MAYSIRLDEEGEKKLDWLKDACGFTNRAETVRFALNLLATFVEDERMGLAIVALPKSKVRKMGIARPLARPGFR